MEKKIIKIFIAVLVMSSLAFAFDTYPGIVVSTNNVEALPGAPFILNVTLSNGGEVDAFDVRLSLTTGTNTILPATQSTAYFNRIYSGRSSTTGFIILTNESISPGIYSITFNVAYRDSDGKNYSTTTTTGIKILNNIQGNVGNLYNFDVVVQDATATSTTLAVVNTGKNTSYATILKIPNQENFVVTGTSSSIIGNLGAGDYTLASFQITPIGFSNISSARSFQGGSRNISAMNFSSANGRNLTVEISFTDSNGIRNIVEKQIPLQISSGTTQILRTSQTTSSGSGSGLTYIIIGVVGILAIVAIFKLRKRIRLKK